MKKFLCLFLICASLIAGMCTKSYAFSGAILPPAKLNLGDTICILEPSCTDAHRMNIYKSRIDSVVAKLKQRGFNVVVYSDSFKPSTLGLGYSTERLRADLFNKAIRDKNVKAIFSFWGGYGAMHLLDKLDYSAFRANRKIFVGFSDETAIELAIFEKSGIITFHGPMVGADINYNESKTFDCLFAMLTNPKKSTKLFNIDDNSSFKSYKEGTCEGQVIGGNLSLIQCMIGTPYEPNYKNKILFFEEVKEHDYKIHRMLWHLKLTGKLKNVSGIIIGSLTPISGSESRLQHICFDVFKDLNIPIIYNVHAGHIRNPITIPIGAKIKIQNNELIVTEPVVCSFTNFRY
ncbi:MAG: LD-carboxypeptidase [Clostridiales bacterium]|nr:LD-carboxypeptidase [Clostridiales bacterium]